MQIRSERGKREGVFAIEPPFSMADITFILPELCAKLNATFHLLPELNFAFYKNSCCPYIFAYNYAIIIYKR